MSKKLRTKILAGYIVIVLIFAAIAGVTFTSLQKINREVDDLTSVQFKLYDVNMNLTYNLSERSSIMRAYMLYGKEDYVTQFKSMTDEYNELCKTLISLADTDENRDVVTRSAEWADEINNKLVPAVRKGDAKETVYIGSNISSETQALVKINQDHASNRAQNIDKISKEIAANQTRITVVLFASTGVAMALALILGFLLANSITKPVKKLVIESEKIAAGDLNVEIDVKSKDEIGQLARAFARMAENLNEVLGNINAASEQVAEGAKQVSNSSVDLAQGATEQASAIEELTASIEEISTQTTQNANHANQANSLSEDAKSNAAKGTNQMQGMLKAMEEINEASSNISKIIKVIDDIAFQTNILALNAAVEAARAGQYGKGFAVVAEEVRNLAARSANAAKETTSMIEGSIKKAEGGTKIAKDTAEALKEIVETVAKVAILVNDIAVASNEQASGISQINQGFMQVSQVVQTNSATSEESAAASEELMGQADRLKEQIAKFRLKKTNRAAPRYDEKLSPDVLRDIGNVVDKKKDAQGGGNAERHEEALSGGNKKVALSDREFGKY
ncbi:MAG: methyl-accepting chemotaxis protein [Bacillota bacterium]|nr:methyl-accepting chemotaxis protein [Bacillota bacterium]